MKRFYDKLTDGQLLEFTLMALAAQFFLGMMLMFQLFKFYWIPIIVLAIIMVTSSTAVYYLKKRL